MKNKATQIPSFKGQTVYLFQISNTIDHCIYVHEQILPKQITSKLIGHQMNHQDLDISVGTIHATTIKCTTYT